MMKHKRSLFSLVLLAIVLVLLAACSQPTPEVRVEKVKETVVVEKPVEKVVKETVVVEKEKEKPFPEGTELHIVQWSHFVPRFDEWFDKYAQEWGDENGVKVIVDHISYADIVPTLAAAIDAGQGPTMIQMLGAPSQFVEGLRDLTDVNMKAQELYGEQVQNCTANSYLPSIDKWYGFCHGWVPDPADYLVELWSAVGYPNGPSTYADLLDGGTKIKEQFGVPVGLGMSPEIDSEFAMRSIIWSFGGSIQDENENVVLNSPEVIEAVKYVADLYQNAMTDEIFSWNAASNNQGLIAGELSYIQNSISAYRSLQKIDPEASDKVGFAPALKGPRGDQHNTAHVWHIYVVPNYVPEGPELEAAKKFMLDLVANYDQATFNSELYDFPAFPSVVPQLEGWLEADPFGSRPPDKLKMLADAVNWTTALGFPGPANPAISEVYNTHIIPAMMGKVARGEATAEEAVAETEAQIKEIFQKWRDRGLVGGGK